MAFLSWRKDYAVGVKQIDAEHRGLFDLINALHDTQARAGSSRDAARILNRLVAYAEEHFQHEERLMSDSGYPLLDAHREQHSAFVASIFAINERLALDTVRAGAEILPFAKNWLVKHIIRSDMEIAEFLRRKARQTIPAAEDPMQPGAAAEAAEQLEQR